MIIDTNQLYVLSLLLMHKRNFFSIGYSDIAKLCCVVKNRSTIALIGSLEHFFFVAIVLNKLSS